MKILFVSLAFPPEPSQSGVVCAKCAIAMRQLGNEIDVITMGSPLKEEEGGFVQVVSRYGIGIHRIEVPYLSSRWVRCCLSWLKIFDGSLIFLPALIKSVGALGLNHYDCVITWSPYYSVNLLGAWIKLFDKQIKWIAQFSDPWSRNPLQQRWSRRAYADIFEPLTLRASDGIVHSSGRAQQEMVIRNGWEAKPRYVLKNCFLEEFFSYSKEHDGNRGNNESVIRLNYVGTLFGKRSPITLFLALRSILDSGVSDLSNLSINLVGCSDRNFQSDPIASALPKGLVRFCGPISYLESLRAMRECDGLLLIEAPVIKNRFVPSKLADYLGAGPPIIALSKDPEIVQTVLMSGGIAADPEDFEDIANAILLFLRNFPIERSRSSRDFIETYNSRNCALGLEGFLKEVIAK